jgi:hypothetical protein
MLIRQSLNGAVHLAAGVAFGALAALVVAGCVQKACRARRSWREDIEDTGPGEVPETSGLGEPVEPI